MRAIYLAEFANHIWQSTLFVGVMWIVAKLLRRNAAAVRYWAWWAASVKFLVPFALLVALGQQLAWKSAPVVKMAAPAAQVMAELEQPFHSASSFNAASSIGASTEVVASAIEAGPVQPVVPVRPASRIWRARWFMDALFAVWLCGIAVGFGFWGRWLACMREIRNSSSPLNLGHAFPVLSSPGQLEPCVIGILRPALILPEGIEERLTAAELDAVLAHEMSHVRRCDNLTSAVHVFVETIFWFWPVLRWVRARLIEEREQACDEAVLNSGNTPHVYAEGVLKVCRHYLAAEPAVAAGISGAQLKQRIERIVDYRESLQLSVVRKTGLALFVLALIAVPVLSGQARVALLGPVHHPAKVAAALLTPVHEEATDKLLQSVLPAQEKQQVASPDLPIQIISLQLASGPPISELITSMPPGCNLLDGLKNYSASMRIRGATGTLPAQCITDRRFLRDTTAKNLLLAAYGIQRYQLIGAPEWTDSLHYNMQLKWNGRPEGEMLASTDPRLESEREKVFQPYLTRYFNLKVHREKRVVPVYDLVPAAGGVKLQSGLDRDGYREGIQAAVAAEPPTESPASGKLVARNQPVAELANMLAMQQGRPVTDHSGLTGRYDFTIPMRLEEMQNWEDVETHQHAAERPFLYSMLEERFGLKLVPSTASVEVLVVDQMERPSGAAALNLQPSQFVCAAQVVGNHLVSKEAILQRVAWQAGDRFDQKVVQQSTVNLWTTGLFDKIDIQSEYTAQCLQLTIYITEKPKSL